MALYNTRLKSEHTDTEELNKAKKMVYKYKTGLAARVKMYFFTKPGDDGQITAATKKMLPMDSEKGLVLFWFLNN